MKELNQLIVNSLNKSILPRYEFLIHKDNSVFSLAYDNVEKKVEENFVKMNQVGSLTKHLTSLLTMNLFDKKSLTLSIKLSELIQGVHEDYEAVTVKDLLCHKGGGPRSIRDLFSDSEWLAQRQVDSIEKRQEFCKRILSKKSELKVGKFNYTNWSYILVGVLLETIYSKSYKEMATDFLNNIGAQNSSIGQSFSHKSHSSNIIKKHALIELSSLRNYDNPPLFHPATGLRINVESWINLIRYSFRVILENEDLLKGLRDEETYTPLGLHLTQKRWSNGLILTHDGSNGSSYAITWMNPWKDYSISFFTNCFGDGVPDISHRTIDLLVNEKKIFEDKSIVF